MSRGHIDDNRNEREVVLRILSRIREDGTYSHVAVREGLDACEDMSAQQRAFIKRLAEGVIERRIELDEVILRHTRKGTRIRPVVRDILRMGIYQILYMDAVPDSAACNEAVKLAKAHGMTRLSGFVNGVLRTVARENENAAKNSRSYESENKADLSLIQEAAQKTSMPVWIASMWEEDLGTGQTLELLQSFLQTRPVTIRVDERLSDEEKDRLLVRLREAGVRITPGRFLPYAYDLRSTAQIRSLPGFQEGLWTVQDESSQMVAEAAGIRGGEIVYDLCAAPGGKTMHCASKLLAAGKGGEVHSFDLSAGKTELIRENIARMHLSNVIVRERDATKPHPEEAGRADVLLCDLPCSGLGVIGRKRDIKYRVQPQQLEELVSLQRRILRAGVGYLKKGGTLIYSTCTIDRRENEGIASFIERELGLHPDPLQPHLPEAVTGIHDNQLQLLPGVHGTDGFFLARFVAAKLPPS